MSEQDSAKVSEKPNPRATRPTPEVLWCRNLWNELHSYAQDREEPVDTEWFHGWEARIPDGYRATWDELVGILPPPLDPAGFFWWTIVAHDRINVLAGKKLWMTRSARSPLLTTGLPEEASRRIASRSASDNHEF